MLIQASERLHHERLSQADQIARQAAARRETIVNSAQQCVAQKAVKAAQAGKQTVPSLVDISHWPGVTVSGYFYRRVQLNTRLEQYEKRVHTPHARIRDSLLRGLIDYLRSEGLVPAVFVKQFDGRISESFLGFIIPDERHPFTSKTGYTFRISGEIISGYDPLLTAGYDIPRSFELRKP
jgi:hypothetical protein